MRCLKVFGVTIVYLIFWPVQIVGQEIKKDSTRILNAEALWELAIAAKGGRTLLHHITSIAEIRDEDGKNVTLVVLPDRYFSWFDARPGQFGLVSKLYNFETGFGCETWTNSPPKVFQDIRSESKFKTQSGRYSDFVSSQFFILLETRWLQPKPIYASKSKIEGKSTARVDVIVEGYGPPSRYAVFLDEKSFLPIVIATCLGVDTSEILEWFGYMHIRQHVVVKGVRIPFEVSSYKSKKWVKEHIELNVDYDPQFFDQVPDYNKNGLQWRSDRAAKAFLKTTVTPLPPEEITQYLADLNSENAEVQQVAVRELGSAGTQVKPQLLQLLATGTAQQRFHTAVLLLQIEEQNTKALEALALLVTNPQLAPAYRQDATFGLLHNETGIQLLAGLLTHPEVQVRRYVIFAFDQLTERAELPPILDRLLPDLQKATKDEDEVVREMTKEALQQIKKRKRKSG